MKLRRHQQALELRGRLAGGCDWLESSAPKGAPPGRKAPPPIVSPLPPASICGWNVLRGFYNRLWQRLFRGSILP